jgi:hypothetical protein
MAKLFYPNVGVLLGESNFIEAIKKADIDSEKSIIVTYFDDTVESFEAKDGNIESYNSGRASFTTSSGDSYTIVPLQPTDGGWISEYKLPLPVSLLKKMLTKSQETKSMPYLEDSAEKMLAFQLPEDEYVFGILYVNQYGAYVRRNGTWVEVSRLDSTFEETVPYEIGRDNAADFVSEFDRGALKVDDAQEYLIPISDPVTQ